MKDYTELMHELYFLGAGTAEDAAPETIGAGADAIRELQEARDWLYGETLRLNAEVERLKRELVVLDVQKRDQSLALCSGSTACLATYHKHGCMRDHGNCTNPEHESWFKA